MRAFFARTAERAKVHDVCMNLGAWRTEPPSLYRFLKVSREATG
jgi:hypothetical protein